MSFFYQRQKATTVFILFSVLIIYFLQTENVSKKREFLKKKNDREQSTAKKSWGIIYAQNAVQKTKHGIENDMDTKIS